MLLVEWQEGHLACKKRVVGCWRGYLYGTSCIFAYMAQLVPVLLTISCSSKSRLVLPSYFTFLVLAHPGIPRHIPHTHTHTRPFYSFLDFVRDNPGEPEETLTFIHSYLSWSSVVPYVLHPSNTTHGCNGMGMCCEKKTMVG